MAQTLRFHIVVVNAVLVYLFDIFVNFYCFTSIYQSSHALGQEPRWQLPHLVHDYVQPVLVLRSRFSALRRWRSGEPPYDEICEGLYVGGWPYSPDKLPPGNPAIIDCTCELLRMLRFTGQGYLCVATWDTRAPQPAEIESAVQWACRKRAQNKPVFVRCAYGHGRSVAVICALLVALGVVEDWKNAEKLIRERRPCIRMNALHRQALEEWSKDRVSSPLKKR